ncbi:hypothetical protein ACFQ3T_34255 [Saccharothrix hoggarensis]|uniref:Glycosyl transferase family 2 n=1 Tax=Saccharothrix hoggarensis TaxID=913853 RepID=A0ABW3R579_9PSEU
MDRAESVARKGDLGSTDDTVARAVAAGARVVHRTDVRPEPAPGPGKGEVLWRSPAATSGDLVGFLDSDLVDRTRGFVPALLGPLPTRDPHPGEGLPPPSAAAGEHRTCRWRTGPPCARCSGARGSRHDPVAGPAGAPFGRAPPEVSVFSSV